MLGVVRIAERFYIVEFVVVSYTVAAHIFKAQLVVFNDLFGKRRLLCLVRALLALIAKHEVLVVDKLNAAASDVCKRRRRVSLFFRCVKHFAAALQEQHLPFEFTLRVAAPYIVRRVVEINTEMAVERSVVHH